jgi:hypothetical protein
VLSAAALARDNVEFDLTTLLNQVLCKVLLMIVFLFLVVFSDCQCPGVKRGADQVCKLRKCFFHCFDHRCNSRCFYVGSGAVADREVTRCIGHVFVWQSQLEVQIRNV